MRDEKLYQTYLDTVMSKKIGTTTTERTRIAYGIASFLELRERFNIPLSQTQAMSNSRVDTSGTDAVERAMNHRLDGMREFNDALNVMSPKARETITSIFIQGAPPTPSAPD